MHHIVASLRPCRSQLQGTVTTAAGRIFTFEAPNLAMIAPVTMQTALKSTNAESKTPQPDTSEPKPDTPDEVAPEIQKGAAPMDASDFNAREGGEGGPGKIPMKDEHVKEDIKPAKGEDREKQAAAGGDSAPSSPSSDQKKDQQKDGSMGPDTFGDSHRLDYSR
jgi:hypothetical protein